MSRGSLITSARMKRLAESPHDPTCTSADGFGDVFFTPIRIGCTTLKHQKLNDASPPSPRQGGASGLEQEGDYIENKIARGIYGGTGKVFGAFGSVAHTAADEAKQANKAAKDAANKAARQARDSVKHVKDAARDAAKTARYCTHKCVLNFRSFIR